MKRSLPVLTIIIFLSVFSIAAQAQPKAEQFPVENSNGEWYVDSAERAGDAKITEFLGRRALLMKNNTQVIRKGLEFVDGTIEFDLAPTEEGHFTGLIFRRESAQNHENIYFRAHKSGEYNAMQYAPRTNGSSTWQLYPEFNAAIPLPRKQWTHLRIEVEGSRMEIFVNNEAKPVLTVSRLRHGSRKGTVGFWARVNNQPAGWATALSNISIRPKNISPQGDAAGRPAPPAGTLASWEIAGAVPNEKGAMTNLPQFDEWRKVEAEESGLVSFNRFFGPLRGRQTAFARTTIKTQEAKTVLLELGYSDDVTVFLNREPVYSGINGFESRHPEYMGFVKPGFENIYLKLRPGNNELILAVSDDQRFGWGFNARLKE
jgi:hypothetical protein